MEVFRPLIKFSGNLLKFQGKFTKFFTACT